MLIAKGVAREYRLALKLRAVMLLESARIAGLLPIPAEALHNLAYFANLLAPIWKLKPLDGKVLRLKRGPYYPDLQKEVDVLVASGVIKLSNLRYKQITDTTQWQILADYELNSVAVEPILNCVSGWEVEQSTFLFIQELVLSISALSDEQLKDAEHEDATYSSGLDGYGNVIDFGEWKYDNPSVEAAEYFQEIMPGHLLLSKGNKLNLFISHLGHRVEERSA
ncbi:hypothetical protein ACTAB8_18735 [Pseudomonas syringae]|uniref:hypothetical protein n=1 Tax=Pseudomonas viridiflava TaxID=33069 RepID=UPI000BBD81CB|nr:hypothetical protein [Pseudomonas viridiflava]PCK91659.1 hypothetical protein PsyrCH409_12995 [Pseudomonas viridiflava]